MTLRGSHMRFFAAFLRNKAADTARKVASYTATSIALSLLFDALCRWSLKSWRVRKTIRKPRQFEVYTACHGSNWLLRCAAAGVRRAHVRPWPLQTPVW